MTEKKFKISNFWKMNILYSLLIISNIVLFIGLISHFSKFGIGISLETFQDIAAAVATMCILGYISGIVPKIKNRGNHPLYGISYILIMCVIGLMTSYFGSKIDAATYFGPYLEMFGILCGVLIFLILATKLKSFKEILLGNFTKKNQLKCLIIFAAVGLFASYAHVTVNGTPANIRCLIVMISGLFGGPIVGIPVGLISGAYRFTLGGATALPCAISTVLSGVIGSLIFIWNDKKFPKTLHAVVLMFLFTGFDMLIVVALTPSDISFPFIQHIYPLMLFASVAGMLLFSIVIKELREHINPQPSMEEEKIDALENKLKEYGEEIEDLKNEIKDLKK